MLFIVFNSHAKQQAVDWLNVSQDQYIENLVDCQTTIDELNWSYNVWPKENKQPKPPFTEVVDKDQIRQTVLDNLKRQAILKSFFNLEITPAMLQHDMNRMAQNTKDANRLKQMFAILNNDPNTIAECISRPYLVQNKLANQYNYNNAIHAEVKSIAEAELYDYLATNKTSNISANIYTMTYRINKGIPDIGNDLNEQPVIELDEQEFQQKFQQLGKSRLQEKESIFIYTEILNQTDKEIEVQVLNWKKQNQNHWLDSQLNAQYTKAFDDTKYLLPKITGTYKLINETGIYGTWENRFYVPSSRSGHTAIWTGNEMIVWGGYSNTMTNSGGRYDPITDSWQSTNIVGSPTGRTEHKATWTGNEMIVWGGYDGEYLNSGSKYNPVTNSWSSITKVSTPIGRIQNSIVWTGTEMIVWGGFRGSSLNSGGRYNPDTDSWVSTTNTNSPVSRDRHSAIWTGSEMIVWGGSNGSNKYNDGARYNPETDSWIGINTAASPVARILQTAIWTGSEMIVWGGYDGNNYLNSGGKYNPTTDDWTDTNIINAPIVRSWNSAIWTGVDMVIWGGYSGKNYLNSGSRYDPETDTWLNINMTNAPSPRTAHIAIWTGTEMVVWGGYDASSPRLSSGGKYDPNSDSWVATITNDSPIAARINHTTLWTGNELIVWGGGGNNGSSLNSGGKYNPVIDSWVATTTNGAPVASILHTAIWTGKEMIVWGGNDGGNLNSGGRYEPVNNTWTPTSTANAPEGRWQHTATWTGKEMIVWGGSNINGNLLISGGRYIPNSDSWTTIDTNSSPVGRYDYSTIWTGDEMIIWGGNNGGGGLGSGGRYNPITNQWTVTNTINAPTARHWHTAIWTGRDMIIWGGYGYNPIGITDSGGRYNPETDVWTAISTTRTPVARSSHTAIWTGKEMIVWGGYTDNSVASILNNGGKYNPNTDSWIDVTLNNAPSSRSGHTAIWTGKEMIVWGGNEGQGTSNTMGIYYSNDIIFENSFE